MANIQQSTEPSQEAQALVSALVDGACEWQYHRDRWTGDMSGEETPPGADMIDAPKVKLLAYIARLEGSRARQP